MLAITITDSTPDDLSYIQDSWARSFKPAQVDPAVYYPWHRQVRDTLLSRCLVRVARDIEEPSYIHGYMVTECLQTQFVLHYAYTRLSSRRQGVYHQLLQDALALSPEADTCAYSHQTYASRLLKLDGRLQYIPVSRLLDSPGV